MFYRSIFYSESYLYTKTENLYFLCGSFLLDKISEQGFVVCIWGFVLLIKKSENSTKYGNFENVKPSRPTSSEIFKLREQFVTTFCHIFIYYKANILSAN